MSEKQIKREPGTELLRIRYDAEGGMLKSGGVVRKRDQDCFSIDDCPRLAEF
jgi:hypothetical protein